MPVVTKVEYAIRHQDDARFFQTGKNIAFLIIRAPIPAPELSKVGYILVNRIRVEVIW